MKKKLYFVSLGCTRNQVDSEHMIAKLFTAGFELSNDIKKSDFVVINTCGFLKEARDEVYSILDDIFINKKKSSKIVVAGCMANLFSDEIKDKYPEVFSIISSGNIDKILDVLKKPLTFIDNLSFLTEIDYSRVLTNEKHLAYLKISEGCSKACAFCIIPKIKGKLISRSDESILKEIKALLSQGVYEINLIAQDLLDYAKDRNEKNAFLKLLKKILKIKKDFSLRLLYVYPDEITDEFIDLIASDKRICKYLDIPLQHVSDNILKSMKRKTSSKKIFELFTKLKKKIPNIAIRASLMVGFPNETEKDFLKLLEFVEKFSIDHLAVFKFSNEKLASSFKLENQIDEKIKDQRFDILTEKQFKLVQKRNKKLIGKTLDAIVDGYHPESNHLMLARSESQAYKVDSNIIINDTQNIKAFGKVHKIKITDISGYDLIGCPLK
ncbi:MAG: Ribosomal protein S12 methylthiotransferase RimO [Candidatus Anoxychlamydiales bacterium]|nr:Ribosomal protein S12 methylthiotransferase RimO [Candidatus Anoxychlamydiales bacterium]NGX35936.1 Ribosomal protein S12 methylthiotransferase RimO [Candidatus Anoxychlamydiales bacterium]